MSNAKPGPPPACPSCGAKTSDNFALPDRKGLHCHPDDNREVAHQLRSHRLHVRRPLPPIYAQENRNQAMSTRTPRVELYRDADKRWRWRAISNGRILSDSGYGYSRRIDALHGMCLDKGVRRWADDRPTTFFDRIYCVQWLTDTHAQAARGDGQVIEITVLR